MSDTYRSDYAAAVVRAEAAEKRVAELEAKAVKAKRIKPKAPREWGAFFRWWRENWGISTFVGIMIGFVVLLVVALVQSHRNANIVPYCYVRRVGCQYGPILCNERYVIVAHHMWLVDDKQIKEVGEFQTEKEAVAKAIEIGCPKVDE